MGIFEMYGCKTSCNRTSDHRLFLKLLATLKTVSLEI